MIMRTVLTRNHGPPLVFADLQLTKIQSHLWACPDHARALFVSARGECTLENHSESGGSNSLVDYALYPKPHRKSWVIVVREG